ncbi:MAG: DUF885 domain-containing protein, partial [Acidobacteria bacterium]|nr:DUF885 domain-containing protein [Acidobacteriota bacterium]
MKTAATIIMMTAFAFPAFTHGPAEPKTVQEETEKVHRLFDAQWEWAMQEFPEYATMLGDLRYNDRLTEQSLEAIERRRNKAREALAEIRTIDRSKLSPADQLNYDLYVTQLEDQIAGFVYPGETMPINQMGGVHQDLAQLAAVAPKRTSRQVEDFITRLRQVPDVVDQTIELMKKGLEAGATPPRITLREVGDLIAAQTPEDATASPIYQTYFAELPESIPAEERAALKKKGLQVIESEVIPSYEKLHRFWVKDYYPGTRESIGLSALPSG